MRIKMLSYSAVVFAAVMLLVSCAGSGRQNHPPAEQRPGTIAKGVYLSSDMAFTVEADEKLWQVKEEDEEPILHLKEDENVWISFLQTSGLKSSMIDDFDHSFVHGYMEGIKRSYPDAQLADTRIINSSLARMDMTMTYDLGAYAMYQIMYLATDGENGYIITSTLPLDRADSMKTEVYRVVESIRFLEGAAQ